MKFELNYASDWGRKEEIEIKSFEELMNLIKQKGRIIIDEDSITIYDDYVE